MDTSEVIARIEHRKPSIMGREQFREFGILLPMLEKDGETHLLFEVRSLQMRSQPGDVCYPGGGVNPDDADSRDCAVRETAEELGLDREDITDVHPLDMMVHGSRIIHPFVGRIVRPEKIRPNPGEVETVFTVPLAFFRNTKPEKYKVGFEVVPEDDFPFELIQGGKDYRWGKHYIEELFYQYDGHVIWGLTAKMTAHFVELLE